MTLTRTIRAKRQKRHPAAVREARPLLAEVTTDRMLQLVRLARPLPLFATQQWAGTQVVRIYAARPRGLFNTSKFAGAGDFRARLPNPGLCILFWRPPGPSATARERHLLLTHIRPGSTSIATAIASERESCAENG